MFGVAVGLLTGRTPIIRTFLNPFLTILRPIPAIALFALLIELGVLGALIDLGFGLLGRRLVHWQQA